ncbi:MAG: DNA primase [Firmicutes bacterium]|nr:DNA primase [Bacillota bacterium]
MTNEQEIENIRTSANIIQVISSYLPLTQKGKNYFGVCPFHEDHSPSMSVSEEKQIYKCFSCGAAGNVFTFVKDYESVSFMEAVKIVADKCGLVFKGSVNTKKEIKNNKVEYEIMDLALKFYQNNLNTEYGAKAKTYLNERNLNDEAIKEFDIGLALDNKHSLNSLLINKKYNLETILNLGLINRNGEFINDTFMNRIIFPIHNLEGEPIGFTGRIYEASDQAKYINSKESIIFKKGQILFNYHRAKKEIQRKKEVIIVEGNMDAIRMYASGIKNVVALMGTSLTNDQVNIIKSLRAKVILLLDNDDAGALATYQNGNILEAAGINPLVVRLSGEKDPDEYIIKNGVEAIIDNISNPISFLDYKLKYLKKNKDLTKTNDLVSYIKDIINNIKDIDDELTKEITIKKMSDEYDVPLDLLKNELNNVTKPKEKKEVKEKVLEKKSFSKYDIAAQNIIYFMINDGKYVEMFKKELGYFNNKKYRSIANEIIYYYGIRQEIDISSFITYIETKEYIYDDVMEIIKNINIEELTMDIFIGYIDAAKKILLKDEIKNLKEQIANELDNNKKLELASRLIELKKGCVGNEK